MAKKAEDSSRRGTQCRIPQTTVIKHKSTQKRSKFAMWTSQQSTRYREANGIPTNTTREAFTNELTTGARFALADARLNTPGGAGAG